MKADQFSMAMASTSRYNSLMQILLDKPELENFIREQVDNGQYSSPTAVVEAALSQLMGPQFAPGELARLIAEGEASIAKGGMRDADVVFAELREKSRIARIKAGK
jgi:Arc/MetJ-type ribon-helix-helix transcriptional regulator